MISGIKSLGLDRKKMMGVLMLGVASGALASVLERVDAALTGGNYTPLEYINTYT